MLNHRRLARVALLLTCLTLVFSGSAAAPAPLPPQPRPTILEFGRETCPICKRMEQVLAQVIQAYGSQVEVRILHVERQEPLYRHYGIVIIPTQVFLDASGKEVFRHEGELSLENLVKKLKELKLIN